MKARIRAKIERVLHPEPLSTWHDVNLTEEYFTAAEVARRLKLHKDTVKNLMRRETTGVIRIGHLRTIERYSASSIERLIRRLERGEDPRHS